MLTRTLISVFATAVIAVWASHCTSEGSDPWATGSKVACCTGLEEILKNWDEDGRYYYKCQEKDGPSPSPVDGLICTDGESKCVADLNLLYSGFDESDASSPLGVPIRGRPRFDDNAEWYFCTGQCYRGQPDCYAAAALINHKIMKTNKWFHNRIASEFVDRYPVLIILQPKTTFEKLTKCAWQYDGAAFNRQNGGCGSGGSSNCDDPFSGYKNKCPSDPDSWADETCQETMRAWCGTEEVDYPQTCYWRGPAFSSPAGPGAQPITDFSDKPNELRDMMLQRIKSELRGSTLDGIPLMEYWDEITMDGRVIDHYMKNPPDVIAAFGYVKGIPGADLGAYKFRDHYHKTDNRTSIPVLAFDTNWVIGTPNGPFVLPTSHSITV